MAIGMAKNSFDLEKDLHGAVKEFPKLEIQKRKGKYFLVGEIDVLQSDTHRWIDTFAVEIAYEQKFPFCFPSVTETSEKIERIPTRHVYTNTNTLCLAVPPEEKILCKYGITSKWFIERVLLPRLAEEYQVNHGGTYSHEYSHQMKGNFEFYSKTLKTDSSDMVLNVLRSILRNKLPRHFDKCICGSEKKQKHCHQKGINELSKLETEYIVAEIQKLELLIKREQLLKSIQ